MAGYMEPGDELALYVGWDLSTPERRPMKHNRVISWHGGIGAENWQPGGPVGEFRIRFEVRMTVSGRTFIPVHQQLDRMYLVANVTGWSALEL